MGLNPSCFTFTSIQNKNKMSLDWWHGQQSDRELLVDSDKTVKWHCVTFCKTLAVLLFVSFFWIMVWIKMMRVALNLVINCLVCLLYLRSHSHSNWNSLSWTLLVTEACFVADLSWDVLFDLYFHWLALKLLADSFWNQFCFLFFFRSRIGLNDLTSLNWALAMFHSWINC